MSGNKQPQSISAASYLKLITADKISPLDPSMRLIITDDVTLPAGLTRLPNVHTVFNRGLNARKSSLTTFDSVVKGDADFNSVKTLTSFGPNAKFSSNLYANKTNLITFNNAVRGNTYLRNVSTLTSIGPDAKFGGALFLKLTSLSTFNNVVAGIADFDNVTTLKSFGPNAKFYGNLYAKGTSLTTFNHEVTGTAFLDNINTLTELGPNCILKDAHFTNSPIELVAGTLTGNVEFDTTPTFLKLPEPTAVIKVNSTIITPKLTKIKPSLANLELF